MAAVRPICEDVRVRGADAVLDAGERFDGVRPAQLRVPAAAITDALAALAPDIRAGLEESIRRLRQTCRGRARAHPGHRRRSGRDRRAPHRPDAAGRSLRPRRAGTAGQHRHHERRSRPRSRGCRASRSRAHPTWSSAACRTRRSSLPAACSASTRSTPSVAPRRWRCSRTARGSAVRSTSSRGPATSTSQPPSAICRAPSASTPRRVRPRSRSSPTTPLMPAFVAADLISQAEHDPMAASVLITDSEAARRRRRRRSRRADRLGQARRAHPHRARGSAVRDRSWSGTWTRPSRSPTATAPSTSRSRPRTRPGSPPASSMPARSSSVRTRPCRSVTTQRAPTTSCPRPGCACHSSGLSVRAFCKNMHVVTYDEAALREVGDHVVTLAEAENLPSHGAAVSIRTSR